MAQGVGGLRGGRKAALLCVALGPAAAAEIFRHLSDDVVEQLTIEMAKTPQADPKQVAEVMQEVVETALVRGYIAEGGLAYARQVLERALGAQKAADLLARLDMAIQTTPFTFLRGTPPDHIYAFLRYEHPQTVALVLAHLPTTELAAKILALMPPEQQAEIASGIATMTQVSPDVIREVAGVMEQKLQALIRHEFLAAGGVRSLAQILSAADRTTERNVLDYLTQENQELADAVRALLFVFEDLMKLDDRAIQLILKEVDAKDLALALRGASEGLTERVLANMSQRAGEMLREEMEYMPPQRRRTVEEAQTKIVAVVRKLEEAGGIMIARGSEDDELVA